MNVATVAMGSSLSRNCITRLLASVFAGQASRETRLRELMLKRVSRMGKDTF